MNKEKLKADLVAYVENLIDYRHEQANEENAMHDEMAAWYASMEEQTVAPAMTYKPDDRVVLTNTPGDIRGTVKLVEPNGLVWIMWDGQPEFSQASGPYSAYELGLESPVEVAETPAPVEDTGYPFYESHAHVAAHAEALELNAQVVYLEGHGTRAYILKEVYADGGYVVRPLSGGMEWGGDRRAFGTVPFEI